MVGAPTTQPPKKDTYIGEIVQSLRMPLRLAYAFLIVLVTCVMGAFASASFVVLLSVRKYTTVMQDIVGIGVMDVI